MPLTISMSAAQLLKKHSFGVHLLEIDNYIVPIQPEALQKINCIRNSYKMIQFEPDDKKYDPGIICHHLLLITGKIHSQENKEILNRRIFKNLECTLNKIYN